MTLKGMFKGKKFQDVIDYLFKQAENKNVSPIDIIEECIKEKEYECAVLFLLSLHHTEVDEYEHQMEKEAYIPVLEKTLEMMKYNFMETSIIGKEIFQNLQDFIFTFKNWDYYHPEDYEDYLKGLVSAYKEISDDWINQIENCLMKGDNHE